MSTRIMISIGMVASIIACLRGGPVSAGVYVDGPPSSVMFPLPAADDDVGITRYEWDFDSDGVYFNGYGYLNGLRLGNASTLFCLPEVDDEVAVCNSFFDIWVDITLPEIEDEFTYSGDSLPLEEVSFNCTRIVPGAESSYKIELTSLILSVPDSQIQIRESPTMASVGQYIVTDLGGGGGGGGGCNVESFFDIWCELSIDGGQNWIPASGSGRMVLIPEPGMLSLLAAAGWGLLLFAWRRRK